MAKKEFQAESRRLLELMVNDLLTAPEPSVETEAAPAAAE